MRSEQFCVPHRMKKQLEDKKTGEVLWEFPAHAALKNFRNSLKAIGEMASENYGWKAFRAGKATQLASQGSSIGEILTAGEWRTIPELHRRGKHWFGESAGGINEER